MVTKHDLGCFDEFTSRFIRAKVRQLIGRAGFTESDRPDLIQDFALNLIRRSEKFDPSVANWHAFVVVVCQNHYAATLEHKRAEKRSSKREAGSLNQPVKNRTGRQVEIGATIPESQQALHTGQWRRSHEEAADLVVDVAGVLDLLPPRLRRICERLKDGDSKTSVARDRGMSQGAFYDLLKGICVRFEKAELRDYLQ